MGTPKKFAAWQGRSERCKAPAQPLQPKPAAPARGSSVPRLPRVQFSSAPWQRERVQRLARICRCLDRGCAAGKPLRKMLVRFAWKWNGRRYKGEPARRMRLAKATLRYLYRRWKASGGNPAALALNYRAPVKLRKGHVLDFARVCVNSDVRSFAGCLGSGEGLRRVQRSVNGVLTGTWRAVSRAVGAVFDKGVVCYG
jgi:hypothetical protein